MDTCPMPDAISWIYLTDYLPDGVTMAFTTAGPLLWCSGRPAASFYVFGKKTFNLSLLHDGKSIMCNISGLLTQCLALTLYLNLMFMLCVFLWRLWPELTRNFVGLIDCVMIICNRQPTVFEIHEEGAGTPGIYETFRSYIGILTAGWQNSCGSTVQLFEWHPTKPCAVMKSVIIPCGTTIKFSL